ncbi:hypothetical protein DV737_g4038, partial [Chaetothyriales sp. CBS 132003]
MDHEEPRIEAQHSVEADYAASTTTNGEESHFDLMPHAVNSSHARDCAPPESLRVLGQQEAVRMNNHLDRFSADILPPPTLPVYLQILTYMQRWGLWAAHVQDVERRMELIKVIAEKMENVWLVGMQQGHIPQNPDELNAGNEETAASHPGANYQFNHKLAADILGTQGRGRRIQQHQRSKRVFSPSREVVIKASSKGKSRYQITVGELEEAGCTMKDFEERLLGADSHDGHEILEEILQHLDRDICERDWHGVTQRTAYNATGRDLEIYCLWELQSLGHELRTLEQLKQGFKYASQVKNTQLRIDSAKALCDQYAAVASVLHDKKKKRTPPGSRVESTSAELEIDRCLDTISSDTSIWRNQPQQPSGEAVSESGRATHNDGSALVDLAKDTSSHSQEKLDFRVTEPSGAEPDEAAHHPRPSRIKLVMQKPTLKIHLKTKPGFELEGYSTRTITNTRGFGWRYIKDSTIAERDAMDEVIQDYVESRIRGGKKTTTKQAAQGETG